ncbi:unnamed protein product [Vitrella brassicaformis CCMP3155]|uniref:Uncharacterized protein n=1 Tax=Vitrella brassicaformis (strain CCMP3155) TaxID=1169540 RepID=A0A0G4EIZ7_VITBC|nr:unnamed protein product [Vitrella brassicaformis CCMP3155]|mmetsp:Transcript_45243/g.112391  ORF Transcript_45243/g.112391 Transcript_45243/m.112391 type:complete len:131 (-) Transcript_45243:444-836(-)|eukprot:CEL95969.1 unnamed protein product [Vitrella brassicaformis CCMP3155]
MLNYVPRRTPGVKLLYGKRPVQRIIAGHSKFLIAIPTTTTDKIYEKVDESVYYENNTYNPLQWKDYVKIKLDAQNLIEADVKSALTNLDFYPKIQGLYAGQQSLAEMDAALKMSAKPQFKFPLASGGTTK